MIKIKHPFLESGLTPDANIMYIGSFPPPVINKYERELYNLEEEDNNIDFFYGNYRNQFWIIQENLFNENLKIFNSNILDKNKTIENFKNHLHKYKLAITDILKSCIRNNELSSKDEDLIYDEGDINKEIILESNCNLYLCTGIFTLKVFIKSFKKELNLNFKNKLNFYNKFYINLYEGKNNNRKIYILNLPSTSRRYQVLSLEEKTLIYKKFSGGHYDFSN